MRHPASSLIALFALASVVTLGQLLGSRVVADEPQSEPAAPAEDAPQQEADAAEDVAARVGVEIRKLDHPQFAEREAASETLEKMGAPAVEMLTRVAKRGSAEASRRAMSVLEKLAHGADQVASQAAQTALGKIVSDAPAHIAERAKQVLADLAELAEPRKLPGGADGPRMQFPLLGQLGSRKIMVQANGRMINIVDGRNGISVEVTERPAEGEETKTTKYQAADLAELKAKHPEAAKIYEEFAGEQADGAGRLQGGLGGFIPPGFFDDDVFGEGAFGEGFPDAFRGFDDDFFRRFEEGLPAELRGLRGPRGLRPFAPEGAEPGREGDDIRKKFEEHRRRIEQMQRELRERLRRRGVPGRRAAPGDGPQPPTEKAPPAEGEQKNDERDGDGEREQGKEGKQPAEKPETIEV